MDDFEFKYVESRAMLIKILGNVSESIYRNDHSENEMKQIIIIKKLIDIYNEGNPDIVSEFECFRSNIDNFNEYLDKKDVIDDFIDDPENIWGNSPSDSDSSNDSNSTVVYERYNDLRHLFDHQSDNSDYDDNIVLEHPYSSIHDRNRRDRRKGNKKSRTGKNHFTGGRINSGFKQTVLSSIEDHGIHFTGNNRNGGNSRNRRNKQNKYSGYKDNGYEVDPESIVLTDKLNKIQNNNMVSNFYKSCGIMIENEIGLDENEVENL